jgi:WD40 repeat protein
MERHEDRVFGLSWSHDGRILASGGGFKDAKIHLWNPDGTYLSTLEGHTSSIYQLQWSPDGKTLASSSYDQTVRLWSGREQTAILEGHPGPVLGIRWKPDGKELVCASMGAVVLWRFS